MMEALTHEDLKLITTDEKFYFVPATDSPEVLEVDRLNFELKLIKKDGVPTDGHERDVCVLFGIIHLISGPYLIVVTQKEFVGNINGHSVYEVKGTDLIPFSKTNIHLSESQERDNRAYMSMIERVLSTPGFYFSHSYDLTHSLQRVYHLSQTKPNFFHLPLHERADDRFVWNSHVLRDLVVLPELRRFIVPILHGFVCIKKATINGKQFTFSLISRRSVHRAGVRYYMRGVDSRGNAANYIETEQIVFYDGHKASFLQTRGSIPLYWSQRPTLKYKPTPLISTSVNQKSVMQKHFDEQITFYGQQVIINLVDQKGPEKRLGEAFQHYVRSLASCLIGYDAFDFHKECSKMRWHRLSILIDKLSSKQDEFGYFMTDPFKSVVSVQQGVFRTNCIDCLDRTNVVQSMLARRSLQDQLQRMKLMAIGEKIEDKKEFESTFKNVWADNADICARQYTGTGALKTDFTRTGKRTLFGLMKDGYNSAIRYYYNNFNDGYRQDAIDLFLGTYIVDRWEGSSSLQVERTWRFQLIPIVFLVGISMLFMSLLLPSRTSYISSLQDVVKGALNRSHHQNSDPLLQIVYVLFWSAAVLGTLFYVYLHGEEFTDSPKLVQKEKVS